MGIESADDTERARRCWRRAVFAYDIAVALVLATLVDLHAAGSLRWLISDSLPSSLLLSVTFGALGGVSLSLHGVYSYKVTPDAAPTRNKRSKGQWDNALLLWHFGKPWGGAIAGGVVWVLLRAATPNSEPSTYVSAAAAFVLGMHDKDFFSYVRRVGSAVLGTATPAGAGPDTVNADKGTSDSSGQDKQ